METCKCFDRRYCPQYVTSANGYTLLTKPITKKSRNRNLQQRWIWFCKYFAKVCRTLWCHCNWSLFIKYHQNISPSSYLNTSFVWTYIPLALKKKEKRNIEQAKQSWHTGYHNVLFQFWFWFDIFSSAVKSLVV